MCNKVFQFEDIYWKQKNGVAMDTSLAVQYTNAYIIVLEKEKILDNFKPNLTFYDRFINDNLGFWIDANNKAAV